LLNLKLNIMRKMKSVLGLFVFALGIFSAFAFKPSTLVNEAFLNSSGNCQTTTAVCSGNAQLCRIDVPEDAPSTTLVDIYNYQSGTSCGTQKRMN
jgi:Family of unknown function (DUF6520)